MTFLALSLFAATICSPAQVGCETPIPADSIADSVGINIHLHNANTVYGNFALIETLLASLGVRHTRDGLIDTTWNEYYNRHIALGKLGLKCLFVTSPSQSEDLLASWPSRVPGAFEGYEAPNEYDLSGDPNWAETLLNFMERLYRAAKSNAATAKLTIVGPSLTQVAAYAKLAGLQRYFDSANMHNYFGGRNPETPGWGDNGYGSISYSIHNDQDAWPGRPIVTTETGYISNPKIQQGIPELIEGEYAPRMILEQALHEVHRTYVYELIDEEQASAATERNFGLARADGSHKPAFTALQNLIKTLSDYGPPAPFEDLRYSLNRVPKNVHHLLLAKRDGSYYLAFWLAEQNYDAIRAVETPGRPENFDFVSDHVFTTMQLLSFDADGHVKTKWVNPNRSIPLTATDCVALLRLR